MLDLSGLGLTEVPEASGQLTWLARLNLTQNQLTQVPNAIGQRWAVNDQCAISSRKDTKPPSFCSSLPLCAFT